jgi:DNA-binding CsgD family transcriptional regulator/tetratricopeptide (TPR) repeat protein
LTAFRQAEELVAGAPPSAERARVLAACASGLLLSIQSEEAIARCDEAILTARGVGARAEEAKALRILAASLANLGDLDRTIALVQEARRIAEEVGDVETVMATYWTAGKVLDWAGRGREAIEEAERGCRRARELGLERAMGSFVVAGLAYILLNSGHWVECERLTREFANDAWGAFNMHVFRGVLLARQGKFAAAREHLDLALRLSPPFYRPSVWFGLAEFGLWAELEDVAARGVAEGLAWWAERDQDGTHPDFSLLYPLALRLEADRAERATARRATDEVAEARRRAAPLLAKLERLIAAGLPQARYGMVTTNLLLARAEQSRLELGSDPERWQAAAAAWERIEWPFEAAYARFRQAEALLANKASRSRAEQALRSAHQTAATLNAAPLRREAELLARRGRLRLDEHVPAGTVSKAMPSAAASLSLTRREVEVLALLAEGRTNQEIGKELFITEGTVRIHVSRILAKLHVANRGQAATIAHRLGLDWRLHQ